MHRIGIRNYSGAPGETVTVQAQPAGSASIKFVLDGIDKGGNSPLVFTFGSTPGQTSKLSIGLFGAVGATCLVDISVVDSGSDRDLLVAQSHDPFPVHDYDFVVLGEEQLAQASSLRGGQTR